MSDEDGQRSRRSSMSDASIGSNQSAFARDIAVMADKVDAADALAKLAKDKYLAANQEHKGYSTALNNKLKDQAPAPPPPAPAPLAPPAPAPAPPAPAPVSSS